MKTLPDLDKSLRLWKLGHEVEFICGQESERNMLALAISNAFHSKKPVKQVLDFIVKDCYAAQPKSVTDLLGYDLTEKILNTLYGE